MPELQIHPKEQFPRKGPQLEAPNELFRLPKPLSQVVGVAFPVQAPASSWPVTTAPHESGAPMFTGFSGQLVAIAFGANSSDRRTMGVFTPSIVRDRDRTVRSG